MKNEIIIKISLICCLLFISCNKIEDSSELNFIDLRTQTVVNISCEQLKTNYSTKRKQINSAEAKKLSSLFDNLKIADKDWNVNARVYGFIKEGSTKTDFCMGNTILSIKGNNYFVDDALRTYILELTKN